MSISENISLIREKIAKSAQKSGRLIDDITLIAVTKTVSLENVKKAIDCGIKNVAENRIQEAQTKMPQLESVKKHLIGHLQTNKAKKAVEMFDVIQSVDSIRLAEEINKQAQKLNKVQDCLIEVKISEEEAKYGVPPSDIANFLIEVKKFENLNILGLMGMAPFFDDQEKARPYFSKLKVVFDKVRISFGLGNFNILSMGMSGDYEVAVQEGANMVRIGTAIFKDE